MRLIRRHSDGTLSLTKDLLGDDEIPPYAILSHVWQHDEVTFDDFQNGKEKERAGYKKIQFCAQQAQADSLHYFWVDTCCINKMDFVELQTAINSMFRWYRQAQKCYVFLYDVPVTRSAVDKELATTAHPLEASLTKSRWFTRGWTLQELLAPLDVIFFSSGGEILGDKKGLAQEIHEITGIPTDALGDTPLHKFGIEERLRWTMHRQTTREEDKAYSLLGIFNIHMPTIYGEGEENAFKRLRNEIAGSKHAEQKESLQRVANMTKEDQDCIMSLRVTDPRLDKKRIEDTKGGLLEDSYRWILRNASFRKWLENSDEQVLWIKGDPGKGKTMLLCGIINELQRTENVAYFFCQGTDARINKATAVLRGVIYMLVQQQPWLIKHIRKRYDVAGTMAFEDVNAWVALDDIFKDIMLDENFSKTCIVVDALDECVDGLHQLLSFIVQHGSRTKWIISSRNWPVIEEGLNNATQKVKLSLELNAYAISEAVQIFIQQKVMRLAQEKKYDNSTRETVQSYLKENAQDTFLWVSLVCQNLRQIPRWSVLRKLETYPPGLGALYDRMMQQINESDDSDLYLQVLRTVTAVFEPITLGELATITEMLEGLVDDPTSVQEIVELCGSFLTVRDSTVYFVHQSAKDFILHDARIDDQANNIPLPLRDTHIMIFHRSINTLLIELKRTAFNCEAPDYSPGEFTGTSLVTSLRYSLMHWIHQLGEYSGTIPPDKLIEVHDHGIVHSFFRTKFLYWLEALSHYRAISIGIQSLALLMFILRQDPEFTTEISKLVHDAHRFMMYNKVPLESSPQIYRSALFFAPSRSLIREAYQRQTETWFESNSELASKQWSACLQTLEGHTGTVMVVAFSHESTRIASGDFSGSIRIWSIGSGACLRTYESSKSSIEALTFSHDSAKLASGLQDGSIRIWDVISGDCTMTLSGHTNIVHTLQFSPDSTYLASSSGDDTTRVWGTHNGECLQKFHGSMVFMMSIDPSNDSVWSFATSTAETVTIRTLEGSEVKGSKTWQFSNIGLGALSSNSMIKIDAFSSKSSQYALVSMYDVILWDLTTDVPHLVMRLTHLAHQISSLAFSPDAFKLAAGTIEGAIVVWNLTSGDLLHNFEGHGGVVRSIAFSHDSNQLVSGLYDHTIKLWDINFDEIDTGLIDSSSRSTDSHKFQVSALAFSDDASQLASASYDLTIKIWDTSSGRCLRTLQDQMKERVDLLEFFHHSTRLVSGCRDMVIKVWDTKSGDCLRTLNAMSEFQRRSNVPVFHYKGSFGTCKHTLAAALPSLLPIGTSRSYSLMSSGYACVTGLCNFEEGNSLESEQAMEKDHFGLWGNWITYWGEMILWLPSEYRPVHSIAQGNKLAIGTRSGKVWIFTLDRARLEELASRDEA